MDKKKNALRPHVCFIKHSINKGASPLVQYIISKNKYYYPSIGGVGQYTMIYNVRGYKFKF